jgi:sulfate adenylyltransferase (ADP) / ATP adenylyltransferase
MADVGRAELSWPERAARQTDVARARGALRYFETTSVPIPEKVGSHEVTFFVRTFAKPLKLDKDRHFKADAGAKKDPFHPHPEPDLVYGAHNEDDKRYHILLNKFSIVPGHSLLVTEHDELQHDGPDSNDLAAMFWAVRSFDPALCFYNVGEFSGASQRHKHMQIVPLPVESAVPGCPVGGLVLEVGRKSASPLSPFTTPLPFVHACCLLPENPTTGQLWCALLNLFKVSGTARDRPSYNLLMTSEFLLVVPRSRESSSLNGNIAVNSMGFAGVILVRNQESLEDLREKGVLSVLCDVGVPKKSSAAAGHSKARL